MKILIIKLGALGDIINTFPLAVTVKKQLNAQIHWLAAPLGYSLVNAHESVDRTILFNKLELFKSLREAVKQIRQTEYDIVLDLQRLFKSALFAMAARGNRKIGFDRRRCKEMSWIFPFERIEACDPGNHMLTQYMEFATHLGIDPFEPGKVTWNIPWQGQEFSGLGSDKYIILNIGASKPANRWNPGYFAQLADMIDKKTSCRIVITGSFEDQTVAQTIKERAGCKIADLTGKTSLKALVSIIDNAECVISCDTGPMHLAAALQTNLIALFGPSDPGRTGPFRGVVIQKKTACTPCNQKTCKKPVCMENIKPEHVMEEILKVL